MQTLSALAAAIVALGGGAWAASPQAPNTAAKAAETALAFFPAPSPHAFASEASGASLSAAWDVTEPAAAIRQQYRAGLNSLQAGQPAPYLALLAPDYTQPGADRSEAAQRLAALLARNQCRSAEFSITDARRESADRLMVRVWQEFVFASKDTPPTFVTTSPGKTFAVNQTGRLTVTQVMQQEWVQSGAAWRLRRSETVSQKAAAVL